MNVYLAPIIDELLVLWRNGIHAYDESRKEWFTLRVALLWTMHDFPGYGVCSSLQTQGHKSCLPCGPNQVTSHYSTALKKVIYIGHRRFLPERHPWRDPQYDSLYPCNKRAERVPIRTTPKFWRDQWDKVVNGSVPLKDSGMKAYSIFYRLPYYEVCTILLNLVIMKEFFVF